MMLLLIFAAFLAILVYRHRVFAAYIASSTSTLLFLMHSDGVAFQYLWPDFPGFNSIASIVTGSGIIIFATNYARVFLMTARRHPVVDKILLAVILLTLLVDAAAFVVDNQIIKKLLVLMSLGALSMCTLSAIVAARTRFKEVRFFLFGWVGIVIASALMNLRHWLGVEISQNFQYDFMRFVMVLDAAMLGLAIADRYNQLRSARQSAMRANLLQAERNLELTRRFTALEKQYALATKIAETKDQQIANTIHDLRQPLHALRLNVENLVQGGDVDGKGSSNVEETFSYLESLVASNIDEVADEDRDLQKNSAVREDQKMEMNKVLASVHDMFLADAQTKGLEFNYVPTSLQAEIEPLVLMRIVTNLVSNAIKYTDSGKILLGCRRCSGDVCVEVHDTGTGMDGPTFSAAQGREVRLVEGGGDPGGSGYGLSIVRELADQNDVELYLVSGRSNGSGVGVRIRRDA